MKNCGIFLVALVGLAYGLQPPMDLPPCGTICVNNMLSKASDLGCPNDGSTVNFKCLCSNLNFSYGIRDCSKQSCPDQNMANAAIAYGVQLCAAAGVAVTSEIQLTTVVSPATIQTVTTTNASFEPNATQGTEVTGATVTGTTEAVANSIPATLKSTTAAAGEATLTTEIPVVITSGLSTFTSLSKSIVIGNVPSVEVSSSSLQTAPAPVESSSFGATGLASTMATILTTDSATTSVTASATGHAKSSTTSGPAARQTVGPIGVVAAAGLAALLL